MAERERRLTTQSPGDNTFSPYATLSRADWARLRGTTPLSLSADELEDLRGLNEPVSLAEVEEIYLPLARLLHLYVAATDNLHQARQLFLGNPAGKVPYVIGIAGSVAVGKSTTARILQALLRRGPGKPRVDLVTTDGFLYPNHILEQRGLLRRKGFPESYDRRSLVRFVADVKSGRTAVTAPVYSHLAYDILPDEVQTVTQPDIMIIEGLNVLQGGGRMPKGTSGVFVSDFFDFSIYVDATEDNLRHWYVERFLRLRATAFRDRASYFHSYAALSIAEATDVARGIWEEINGLNLRENIAPTRERAHLILKKGKNHLVKQVRLRKL